MNKYALVEESDQKFEEIENCLNQALSIVREQHLFNNHKWIKAVDKILMGSESCYWYYKV